jgi:hypothetical protein
MAVVGMARKTRIVLIDDLDGSEAAETVSFALDGIGYEIDLSEGNAAHLRDALSTWVSQGRRTGGRARRGTRRTAPASDTAQIRQWAQVNGYTVSDRGRVSQEIRDAYCASH